MIFFLRTGFQYRIQLTGLV